MVHIVDSSGTHAGRQLGSREPLVVVEPLRLALHPALGPQQHRPAANLANCGGDLRLEEDLAPVDAGQVWHLADLLARDSPPR